MTGKDAKQNQKQKTVKKRGFEEAKIKFLNFQVYA